MADFNDLKSAQSLRRIAKGGANRSSEMNDSFEEILHDLAELFYFVNNTVIPIINGLGAAGTYTDINAVTQGLDGKTLLTDNDFADVNNAHFYNVAQGRPKTVKETALRLSQDSNTLFAAINEIKARLGAIDQDENTNPATLAEIENQLNYFIGIVRSIQSNTEGFLTKAQIAAAIDDGTIDPASYGIGQADITLNAGLRPTDVSGIDLLVAYDYTGGIPDTYDLTDSVMRVKEFVEDIAGDTLGLDSDAATSFANSGLSGDSLKTHREKVGTGTPDATNPHGLDIGDLDDTNSVTSRTTQVASFEIMSSGLVDSDGVAVSGLGGYAYVPESYTITRVAGTARDGGTVGLTITVSRNRGGVVAALYTDLSVPASSPGNATATGGFDNTDLEAGDLIYISAMAGDGWDGRVFVWGTPS